VKPHDRLSVFNEIKKERDLRTDDQDISGPYLLQRLAGSTRRRGKLLGPLIRLDIGLIRTDFTDLNLYCIKGALALFVLVSFSGYVC